MTDVRFAALSHREVTSAILSQQDVTAVMEDHETRLERLEPVLPMLGAANKTWVAVKYGVWPLLLFLLLDVKPDSLMGHLLHRVLPTLW